MKPKQQSWNRGTSAKDMNQRELTQMNPATTFGKGIAPPDKNIPPPTPGPVKYKGRKITAQPDKARVEAAGGKSPLPMLAPPKTKRSVSKAKE
jgi:hypothetical protein